MERTTHGVSLTANGKYAVEIAHQILLLNDQMHDYFSQNNPLSGEIVIASSSYHFNNYFFPEIFVDFMEKYPDIHLQHRTMTNDQAIQAALERSVDISFFNNVKFNNQYLIELPEALIFTSCAQYNFYVMMSPDSPLCHNATLSLKTIWNYPFVFFNEQLLGEVENSIIHLLIPYLGEATILKAESMSLYRKLIDKNMAMTLCGPGIHWDKEPHNRVVIPIRDNLKFCIGYITSKDPLPQEKQNLLERFLTCFYQIFNTQFKTFN